MTDPGLSDRLRQKSRRAGLAVGLTMALTIAICIAGATAIYAALVEPLSDLIPISAPAVANPTPAPAVGVDLGGGQIAQGQVVGAERNQQDVPPAPPPTEAPAPTEPPAEPTATPAPFKPTHQISARESVNFRAGPSTSDQIIVALPPSTPLRYLDEDAPTQNPSDGERWMKFETEDGQEGWVREIDTVPYQP